MSYAIVGLGKRYDINRGGKIGGSIRDGITDYFRDLAGRSKCRPGYTMRVPDDGHKALAREFGRCGTSPRHRQGERIGAHRR
jgi:hypothetical protein